LAIVLLKKDQYLASQPLATAKFPSHGYLQNIASGIHILLLAYANNGYIIRLLQNLVKEGEAIHKGFFAYKNRPGFFRSGVGLL